MQLNVITIKAKLLVKCSEHLGYQTLVFEDLEYKDADFKYITCVKFPNWDCNLLTINDVGFLSIKYIEAGKDTWFDGNNFVPYRYTNIQFLKFIKIKESANTNLDFII